jgi:hypothetical protein
VGVNRNTGGPVLTGDDNCTTNGTASVTFTSATNLSFVSPGDLLEILTTKSPEAPRTDGIDGTRFYDILGVNDAGDTLTVTPKPGSATGQDWYIWGPRPRNTVISDNLFVGAGSAVAMSYAWPMHSGIRVDRNIYWSIAGDNVVYVKGGNITKANGIAALRGVWDDAPWATSGACTDNDANSLFANPLFMNASASNFALSLISPAIGVASDGTTIGAWQPTKRAMGRRNLPGRIMGD